MRGRSRYEETILRPILSAPGRGWKTGMAVSVILALIGLTAIVYTVSTGIGTWGTNKTVGWALDITNFVWWIGIGHAGTLISAILLLFRQEWRTSLVRTAEAMTVFAVLQAALFPLVHLGRVWDAFWMIPLNNNFGPLWVNFNSPLMWDFFAIFTYFTVSVVFWYLGMLPDLAVLRDRLPAGKKKNVYRSLSLGWDNSASRWYSYDRLMVLLAAIATPLVISVHTIVSLDFAVSVIPGWHTTIFPPYFVAGAIFSGLAMVQLITIALRRFLGVGEVIPTSVMETVNKLILASGSFVVLAYLTEYVMGFLWGTQYEQYTLLTRLTGEYRWIFFLMVFCNAVLPQLLWIKRIRTNVPATALISAGVAIGMWAERFIIVVTSLVSGYLPSSWTAYVPTWAEAGILLGTIGAFGVFFLLFVRYVPAVSLCESRFASRVKKVIPIENRFVGQDITNYPSNINEEK